MSISRDNAKIFIARVIGGASSPQILQMCEDALLVSFNDWENAKNWKFLLKDTGNGFRITGVTLTASTTVNSPSSGAFDHVNIGITVTGSGVPANATVTGYTRNDDGTVATIVLSDVPTPGVGITLTFGKDIPILTGVQEYNAPSDFRKPYHARLYTRVKWPLSYIEYRDWNRIVLDQNTPGAVETYTVYNPVSPLSQNFGTKRLRVMRIPHLNDTMFLQYYRVFNQIADPLDFPNAYLYSFLKYAQWKLAEMKNSLDERLGSLEKVSLAGLAGSMTDDEEETEDTEVRMKSQMEASAQIRPLWTNGDFFPDYGV